MLMNTTCSDGTDLLKASVRKGYVYANYGDEVRPNIVAMSITVTMFLLVLVNLLSIFKYFGHTLDQWYECYEISTESQSVRDLKEVHGLSLLRQTTPAVRRHWLANERPRVS